MVFEMTPKGYLSLIHHKQKDDISLKRGHARFWHTVYITEKQFGTVYLVLAKPHGTIESWLIVSDQPTATLLMTTD